MTDYSGLVVALIVVALVLAVRQFALHAPRPTTVLVCGATGVGKSTLINAIAGRPAAQTQTGMPVTQNIARIDARERGFTLYDSRGLEVEDADRTYLLLLSDLLQLRYDARARDQLDLVLMCILEPGGRVDDAHKEIAGLCEDLGIPLGVALTQTEGRDGLRQEVERLIPTARFVMPVRALELKLGAVTIPPENLEALTDAVRADARWDAAAAVQRARAAPKTMQLAASARRLATGGASEPYAWGRFASASFALLDRQTRPWILIQSDLAAMVKKALVGGFFARVFATKFDEKRIDTVNAQCIVPFVIRRFGDGSQQLTSGDLQAAHQVAMHALEKEQPFRSRF